METTKHHKVPAVNFIGTMMANVNNEKLSDADFRELFRNTLLIVEKPALDKLASKEMQEKLKKFYVNETRFDKIFGIE